MPVWSVYRVVYRANDQPRRAHHGERRSPLPCEPGSPADASGARMASSPWDNAGVPLGQMAKSLGTRALVLWHTVTFAREELLKVVLFAQQARTFCRRRPENHIRKGAYQTPATRRVGPQKVN
jgi:hypothetical protein